MNTQQLQCFLYVADRLNFTKAAEDLYLSVPTVTHHIKNLEEELGCKLFFRTSRMVRLTDAGSSFYTDAKEIFDRIMISHNRIQQISQNKLSLLKIGCSSHCELEQMQWVIRDLRKQFPNVHPEITVSDLFHLRQLFENRQIDLVLASRQLMKNLKEFHFFPLRSYQNLAILPPSHPLEALTELNTDFFKDETLITLHPRLLPFHTHGKLFDCIIHHARDHSDIICENDTVAIMMSRCGYGISILPEIYIPKNLEDLRVLPILNCAETDYGIFFHQKTKEISYFLEQYEI